MFATSNPNFTIITPGGCNAKCSFCSDPMNGKPAKDYIVNLARTLANLPSEIDQVSISGGEPTISREFMTILWLLKASRRFRKVVLTTNGSLLANYIDDLSGLVNHINISRHAIGTAENKAIFGTSKIPTDIELTKMIAKLNVQGIDVTLNHVYSKEQSENYDVHYALDFAEYAKKLGASAVAFRFDQSENDLGTNPFEQSILDYGYKKVNEGGCPVCRSYSHLMGGIPVMCKSSMQEPADALGDVPYELIYHINGTLCTDWAAKRIFDPTTGEVTEVPDTSVAVKQANRRINSLLQNSVVKKTDQLLKDIEAAPPKIIKQVARPAKIKSLSDLSELPKQSCHGQYVATGQPDTSGCGVPQTYADCDQRCLPQTGSCGQPINRGGC